VSNVPTSNLAPLAAALEALRSLGGEITYAKDRGGEIETLAEHGVPVFALRPDPSRYFDVHHTAADTLDKVDAVELQENTAVVAALVATLANAPLPVVPPPAAEAKK
jgi:carboxypeptidase Q